MTVHEFDYNEDPDKVSDELDQEPLSWYTQNGNKFNRQDWLLSGSPLNNWDYTDNNGNTSLIGNAQATNDDVFIYPHDLDIIQNMSDIEHIINYHLQFLVDKYTTKQDYYKGRHQAIITRAGVPLGQPDDRLINNIPKQLVDTFNGYAFGQTPDITYDDPKQQDDNDSDDNPMDDSINQWLDITNFEENVDELAKEASIYGRSYLYAYRLKDGLHYAVCSPIDTIMVYDDTVGRNPMFAIRYSNQNNRLSGTLITQQADYQFQESSGVGSTGKFTITNLRDAESSLDNQSNSVGVLPSQVIDVDQHTDYPCLPIFELYENRNRVGIFDDSINNIDDFNQIMSMKSNDVHSYSNNYLVISGPKLSKSATKNIVNRRLINLYQRQQGFDNQITGPTPSAEFIQPEANDTMQENMLDRLRSEIYRTAQVVDPEDAADGQDANAISGVVLKQRYSKMHVKASQKSNALTRLLRNVFKIYFTINNTSANAMNIKVNYNFNDPHNILEEAQTASYMNAMYPKLAIYSTTPDLLGNKTPKETLQDYKDEGSEAQQAVAQATNNIMNSQSAEQSGSEGYANNNSSQSSNSASNNAG